MNYRSLAACVIRQALFDHIRNPALETELFLTGQTEIALFWFQCAGVRPLSARHLDIISERQRRLLGGR